MKTKSKWEYGDFQTPDALAEQAVRLLKERLCQKIGTIIEPTCGRGSFLVAAANAFPAAKKIVGLDINTDHLAIAKQRIKGRRYAKRTELVHADFFQTDWRALVSHYPKPILVVGNPPWVTSADLGTLRSANIPSKSNFQGHRGIEAITGKANFDISEWMLYKFCEWLRGQSACIAMLCKQAVARKVLRHAWKAGIPTKRAAIYTIDADKYFNAAVDACFFVLETQTEPAVECQRSVADCEVYDSLDANTPVSAFGYHDDMVVANAPVYLRRRQLLTGERNYSWRSGVKHDCSAVMELEKKGAFYVNGLGEKLSLETQLLYPLLKSSDLGNGRISAARRFVLITQAYVGQNTDYIREIAPRTWSYLVSHKERLDGRRSSIYRNKPSFAIFGIGPYAFSEWKVGISGFYKKLHFSLIGPLGGKPTMVDDTVYFIDCRSQDEAECLVQLLNSEIAKEALGSLVFWSDKRPITVDLLSRLNLQALAKELGLEDCYLNHLEKREKVTRRTAKSAKAQFVLAL